MTLWFRVRRGRVCSAVIALLAPALYAVGETAVVIPSVFGTLPCRLPLAFIVPLAVAITVAYGFTTGDPLLEEVAGRRLRGWDAAYVLGAAVGAAGVCLLTAGWTESEWALGAGRNALGYLGLVLLGRRVLGAHAASMLPLGALIGSALLGAAPDGQSPQWAWPLVHAPDAGDAQSWIVSWIIAGATLLLGVLTLFRRDPRAIADR
jgi:hypothetical protein